MLKERHFYLAAASALILTFAACSPATPASQEPFQASATPTASDPAEVIPTPSGPCDLTQGWSLNFSYSGGFAGLDRALTLNADGRATAVDRRGDVESSGENTAGELEQLEASLLEVCPQTSTTRSKPCPDCFTYSLSLSTSQGRPIDVRLSDGDEIEPELLSLLSQLRQLTDRLLE
ncbi:MAG: hypothetical protein PVF85_12680 [Anaerolineales bacterium]|jgi:hypothetical protein